MANGGSKIDQCNALPCHDEELIDQSLSDETNVVIVQLAIMLP
jgi:hypothetical protein